MKNKPTSFFPSQEVTDIIQQYQEVTGRSKSWCIKTLIKKGYYAIRAGKDMGDQELIYEDRIMRLNEAWKKEVDLREKEMLELTEKLNRIELAFERSAIRE